MPKAGNVGSPFDEELTKRKTALMEEAERIVTHVFPERYLTLDSLIEKQFCLAHLNGVNVELPIPVPDAVSVPPPVAQEGEEMPAAKKRKTENGTPVLGFVCGPIPSNAKIVLLMDILKPIVRDAVEAVNKVKMWISYLIPRIEDGNNFGVSIQEDTLAEVRTVEAEAASFLDQISRYLLQRGRLVCKAAKYPHVEDYRRSVADMDEKQFLNLRLTVMELRNHYGTLHDVITKNLDKIKTPRTNNTVHLY